MKINKKNLIIISVLILFIVGISFSLFLYMKGYNFNDITIFLGDNLIIIALFFLLIFSVRIFLFIPSTIIIISLGYLLNNFVLTFFISYLGVFIGLLQTYYIGKLIKSDVGKGKLIKKMEPFIEKYKENGFKVTFFGCILPFMPTDIICFSAGFIRYNIKKFLFAGMLGLFPLVLAYSYFGVNAGIILSKFSNYLFFALILFTLLYFLYKKIKK